MCKIAIYLVSLSFYSHHFAYGKEKEAIQNKHYDSSIETSCHFDAFVTDVDPKGLFVRKEASAFAKVLGSIPPMIKPDSSSKFSIKPEVKVLGAKNGWFKIKEAQDNVALLESFANLKPRKMFTGIGWVSGKMLTVKSQSEKSYSLPTNDSSVVYQKSDGADFDSDDNMASLRLIGCRGNWVYVEDRRKSKNKRYWLNNICGLQETSCDGSDSAK